MKGRVAKSLDQRMATGIRNVSEGKKENGNKGRYCEQKVRRR